MTYIKRFINAFFNRKLDLRVRLFNILAIAGVLVSVSVIIAAVLTRSGLSAIPTNIVSTILSAGILYYSYRSGKYKLCYMITIVAIFLILFPILFIESGGYVSGMPLYFIFAVVFTAFMLEGKRVFIIVGFELILYSALCLFAYYFPQYITFFETELDVITDILISLYIVCIALCTTMWMHFKLYNEQQRELEKARQRLSEENAALEEINRMKTEFLANISHELKTPLTVMSGYAQISEMQFSENSEYKPIQDKMKIISSEAERLALMVGQILDVTRIEEGQMDINLQSCNIDEVIQSAVDTYFPILNKNNNRLFLKIESELPRMYADPTQITQVIVNLVTNAIRFTFEGSITISAVRLSDFIEISVTDTGRGIAPETLPHIFERYNRGKSQSDTGTGLGLYICKHIIDNHGGTISVKSEIGTGSAFSFTVPINYN